ncbi:ABC transporter substrate-binding protein [Mycolicibacterium parafortuitum]
MIRSSRKSLTFAGIAASLSLMAAACGGTENSGGDGLTPAQGDCPVAPLDVVVSVDQWGDIVSQLAGACAEVTTVLAGSSVDPHDFEPAPSDAVAFEGAQLVVVNGGHYDEWATKLAETSAPDAAVVDAVDLAGAHSDDHGHEGHEGHEGDHEGHDHSINPHVWYRPDVVTAVADAVTAKLSELSGDAAGYFSERRAEFAGSMQPYDDAVATIRTGAAGKRYAAVEGVFDDMAAALGLANRTPPGYQAASDNEGEPSPADLDAFLTLLSDRGVDVLIYNVQTEGSVPEQIRAAADQAGIPVVEVTETLPPGAESFQDWQVGQLDALAEALGVGA